MPVRQWLHWHLVIAAPREDQLVVPTTASANVFREHARLRELFGITLRDGSGHRTEGMVLSSRNSRLRMLTYFERTREEPQRARHGESLPAS